MNRPSSTFPPLPPSPPDPPFPRHTPWLPEPRPMAPGPVSASAWLLVRDGDRLAERLLDQRVVALAGELDDDAVNRAVAALALLDASGDDPVELRLSGVSADLDATLPIVDALDLMGAPVHATALGRLTGPAVALLAVADHRVAGAHAVLHLCEPTIAARHPRARGRGLGRRADPPAARPAGAARRRLQSPGGRDRGGHARRPPAQRAGGEGLRAGGRHRAAGRTPRATR